MRPTETSPRADGTELSSSTIPVTAAVMPAGTVVPARHPDAPAPGERMRPHYNLCVGCGPDHPTGLHVVTHAGEGLTVSASFTVTVDHQGAPGLAHGGMLGLAFDDVLGRMVTLTGHPAVTGHLEIDFRRPVPVGTTLHIDARVDGMAGRKIYTSAAGHAGDPSGPVSVTASAIFVTVPIEHFSIHGRAEDVAAARARLHAGTPSDVNP